MNCSRFWLLALCTIIVTQYVRADVVQCSSDSRIYVSETLLDSEVEEVKWIGNESDHKTILARTRLGVVWFSDTEGREWRALTDQLVAAKVRVNSSAAATAIVKGIIPTASFNHIYLVGLRNDLWTSSDRGQTWTYRIGKTWAFDAIGNVLRFKPHPTEAQIAVGISQTPRCSSPGAPGSCIFSLWITTDFAQSWQKISDYVATVFWGNNGKIWYDHSEQSSGSQDGYNRWIWSLVYTTDYGKTKATLLQHVAGFVMKYDTLFVAQILPDQLTMQLLSARKAGDGPLRRAKFPYDIQENRYTILDTEDHFMFINVETENTAWGNLYVSDDSDSNFVLSLERNKRDPAGHVAFLKVKGLDGIYLANVLLEDSDEQDHSQTMITFNKGGKWHHLTPPANDSFGHPIKPCRGCTLHLHGVLRDDDYEPWGGLYSKANALGLIFATGNIGTYLSTDANSVATYFSRDAGINWEEVRKGSHVYEFGDHGAITILAKNMDETDTLLYSWNEGANWTECKFVDDPFSNYKIRVNQILGEPLATGTVFLLEGVRDVDQKQRGVLVTVDFSSAQKVPCTPQDYEPWTPSDASGRNCLLGESKTYLRRKRNVECYNGEKVDRNVTSKICACGTDDYECDYCYAPDRRNGALCVPVCNDTISSTAAVPPNCKDYFYVSSGYRLVDGDKCDPDAGLDKRPTRVACPPNKNTTHPLHDLGGGLSVGAVVGIVLSTIFGMIILTLGIFIYLMKASDRIRTAVGNRLPKNINDVFSKYGFAPLSRSEFPLNNNANRNNDITIENDPAPTRLEEI